VLGQRTGPAIVAMRQRGRFRRVLPRDLLVHVVAHFAFSQSGDDEGAPLDFGGDGGAL